MSGRILIVDNVATNRILLKVKLRGACYDVVQAITGKEALAVARRERPDLILLEMHLHDMAGAEVCKTLKADTGTCSIPVVMMAAQSDNETRLSALRAGADDFLTKPFDELILLARVRRILRAQSAEEELKQREVTSRELGFAESPQAIPAPANIALVGSHKDLIRWKTAPGRTGFHHQISVISPETALNWNRPGMRVPDVPGIASSRNFPTPLPPDVFVIPGDMSRLDEGLRMLSELRSRPETRHAGIVMLLKPEKSQQAVIALDLGANDIIPTGFPAEELALRIEALLQRKRRADRLRESVRDRLRQAMQDPLTGLYNRRYAISHLTRISDQAQRDKRPFAVMMLDIDRFKRVNDTWGHAAGDKVIAEVAKRLADNMRSIDLVARIGGEEFLIAMPDTSVREARAAAERLRRVIEEVPILLGTVLHRKVDVTLSIGVSMGGITTGPDNLPDQLLRQADKALYDSKSHGRNTVSFCRSAA